MHGMVTTKSPKSSVINVRIAPEEKRAADAVMAELGVTPTEVIRMLYRQISLHRRLPFDVALPPETLTAMNDAKSGRTERLALDGLKAQLDAFC